MLAVADCQVKDYQIAVPLLLDRLNINWSEWKDQKVALKPNLVSHSGHPFTSHPALVQAVAEEISRRCDDELDLFIIEGSPFGTTGMYARHGYLHLPYRLIDIDTCGCYYESKADDPTLPSIELPVALRDAKLVSLAVLKEHSDCVITACSKNLVGLPRTSQWSGNGLWKTKLHDLGIDKVVRALNKHKPIDLAILDATIGTRNSHIDGDPCDPPLGKLLMGDDAFEVDRAGAKLLGIDPSTVPHLN